MAGMNNLVLARYQTNAGQTISDSVTTVINFEDLVYDPYGLVTTGANWVFTANHAGYYAVTAAILFEGSTAWAVGEIASLMLYKNAGLISTLSYSSHHVSSGTSIAVCLNGSDLIYLASGDTIDIRAIQTSGGNLSLYNDANYNYVSIWKV